MRWRRAVAAAAVGLAVAFVMAFALFWIVDGPPLLFEDEVFSTRDAAIRQANDDAGAIWPGTSVTVTEDGSGHLLLVRRWLFLYEARVRIDRLPDGAFEVSYQIDRGGGEVAQVITAVVLPAFAAAAAVYMFAGRRAVHREAILRRPER